MPAFNELLRSWTNRPLSSRVKSKDILAQIKMDAFNELLRSLPFQFTITANLDDELARLHQGDRDRLAQPLVRPELTLYYPISLYDEFGLSPVRYSPGSTTPLDMIREIKATYQARVPEATIATYKKRRPESYQGLVGTRGPYREVVLSDLVGDRRFIDSIEPFQNGFRLNLVA